jgi:PII-like signaling protein
MKMKNSGKQPSQPMKKMPRLQVIIRNADRTGRKYIIDSLFSLYKEGGISDATAWMGVRGYGSRGVSGASFPEIAVKLPIIVETVDKREKIEPLLSRVKEMVGKLGLITLEEVDVI